MSDRPSDLVPLRTAARAVDRSVSSIRRWVRDGAVARYEGDRPAHGGSPTVLVSLSELHTYVVTSGLQPHVDVDEDLDDEPTDPGRAVGVVSSTGGVSSAELELARLRGELAAANVRAELASAVARVEALEQLVAQLRGDLGDARGERDEWRERCEALEAELRASRSLSGLPWWRRFLPPPRPE